MLCPVMLGRERELRALQASWESPGHMVVVLGTAGIGKSRLVREFAAWAREAGGTALVGRCSPTAAEVPLRPLREALLTAARNGLRPSAELAPFLPTVGALVPDWAATAGPGGGTGGDIGTIVLAEGLLRLMTEWSTPGCPALLVLEDVHWSDPETLKVLEYLADHLDGQPVLVVATARGDQGGAGVDMIDMLAARRVATAIDVEALDPSQSEAVLRECLGVEALPAGLAEAVVARSDGIPFFIEELLASALANPTGRVVPSSIGAALGARLGSLPEPAAELLRYAAVLGRQFDWHVAAAALRCPPDDAIVRLRLASGAQLIEGDNGGFRFRHALTVDAVQALLLPEEHQAICASLSETLENLHPDLEGEICQLAANLAEGAGNHSRAGGTVAGSRQTGFAGGLARFGGGAGAPGSRPEPSGRRPGAAVDVGAGWPAPPGPGGRAPDPFVSRRSWVTD